MDKNIFEQENNYLNKTISLVREKIEELENHSTNNDSTFEESNAEYINYLKDNANKFNDDDFVEIVNLQGRLADMEDYSVNIQKELSAYSKMLDKPYFAKINIKDIESTETEDYYIGLHSLINKEKKFDVVDWRSPIASIFYDYEKGKCQIRTNSSILHCDLLGKRQFGIESGKLNYYIDTDINIEDNLLQEALAQNASNQMKSIVQTIQKEQNEIIRGDENKNLIVQGVAGSGKTAIALHRIAYLLYKLKTKITSKDIMFVTPNNAFASYISSVLPDLAEDDVDKFQLDTYARNCLKKNLILEKKYEQMERLILSQDLKEYTYKTSYEFLQELLNYAKANYIDNFYIDSFEVNGTLVDGKKIMDLFFGKYKDRDLFTRFKWITDNIFDMYFYRVKSIDKTLKFKQYIFSQLYKSIDNKYCVRAYMNFLKERNLKLELVGDKVKNEDAYAILLLKLYIYGLDKFEKVRFVSIDEMQDYSAVQTYILNYLFDCPKTVLGDFNQTINPKSAKTALNNLSRIFKGDNVRLDLVRTYRSTQEIVEFYNQLASSPDSNAVGRSGNAVEFIEMNKNNEVAVLKENISQLQAKGCKSIAIITKTSHDAKKLHSKFNNFEIGLIDDNTDYYDNKVCIISVYNSKGLEFDGVIIYNVNTDYSSDIDKNLLYIASTRALHELKITYVGEMSRLIRRLDND